MDISQDLLRYGKRDNSKAAAPAKAKIRGSVLDEIGAEAASVFDAFAGEGEMFKAVWSRAGKYVGCDNTAWYPDDQRMAFAKADNRRVLRAIDLRDYNIFDLDAHGSPWEQLYLIAARRPVEPKEIIGVVLTEGLGLKMNMGGLGKAMAKLARVKTHLPGMGAARSDLIERALGEVCRMMRVTIVKRWQATGNKGSRVTYIGLVLRGDENQ
jgi:hypothetical protein